MLHIFLVERIVNAPRGAASVLVRLSVNVRCCSQTEVVRNIGLEGVRRKPQNRTLRVVRVQAVDQGLGQARGCDLFSLEDGFGWEDAFALLLSSRVV